MDIADRIKKKVLENPGGLAKELYTLEKGILGRVKKITSSYIIGDLCCTGTQCKYDIIVKFADHLVVKLQNGTYKMIIVTINPSIEWKENEKRMISDPFTNHILINSLLNGIYGIQSLNGAGLCKEGKEGYLLQESEIGSLEEFINGKNKNELSELIPRLIIDVLTTIMTLLEGSEEMEAVGALYHPTISTFSCYMREESKELMLGDFSLSSLLLKNGSLLLPKGYEKKRYHEEPKEEEEYFSINRIEDGVFFGEKFRIAVTLYLFISSLLLNKRILSVLINERYSALSGILLFSIWHPEEVSTLWKRVNEKKKPFDVLKGLKLRTNIIQEIIVNLTDKINEE